MLLMMWSRRVQAVAFAVRMPSAWMIRSNGLLESQPATVVLQSGELGSCMEGLSGARLRVSSMSSRRAWCQSRLNSSCSRASSSVRLNISLSQVDPEDGLHRPVGTAVVHAVHGSKALLVESGGLASFRKTSAQLLSRRLAYLRRHQELGLPERSQCGSRIRNILPSLGHGPAAPTTFYYIIPTLPQAGEGFLRTNQYCCNGPPTISQPRAGAGKQPSSRPEAMW